MPHMMFCVSCRRQYKSKTAYRMHLQSDAHRKREDEFSRNRREHMAELRLRFTEDFVSLISQLDEYMDVEDAYRKHLSRNALRFNEAGFKTMGDVLRAVEGRVALRNEDGRALVRKLGGPWEEEKEELDFSGLERSFELRVVERAPKVD
jgi:hypothetical protein